MAAVNKVILVGNLGADPDMRETRDGRPIVHLSVATSESWTDRSTGERREKTEWHRVVIFSEGLAKVAETYLKKGAKVYVEGQLATRKWQDRDGQDRYTTEVVLQGFRAQLVMLDRQGGNGPGRADSANAYGLDPDQAGGPSDRGPSDPPPASAGTADMDDDIPF